MSEFLGNNYIVLGLSKAIPYPVGVHPVLEPIFKWTVACRPLKPTLDALSS
jgi:hypothetical protein